MEPTESKKHIVPNAIMLAEVGKLIAEGHPVTIKVKGSSMLPFIVGDRDSVRIIGSRPFFIKDIVLAEISPGHYVLHRIEHLTGNEPDDEVTLMGDGNLIGREHCKVSNLVGRVDRIFRNGKEIDPYSRSERMAVSIWLRLLFVRRWLLGIYRRVLA
jgi:hypothetical protein